MSEGKDKCEIKRWDILKRQLNNIQAVEAREQLQNSSCHWIVIDCRRADEYTRARIPGAVNIDYLAYEFWGKISALPMDATYLVYCNSCRRSTRACTLMKNGGFQNVYNLDGGLNQWLVDLGDDDLERIN